MVQNTAFVEIVVSARFKVLVSSFCPALAERLKQLLPPSCSAVVLASSSEDEMLRLAVDIDVIVGGRVSRKVLAAAPKLKMIQTIGTGVDTVDVEAATERGVIVCSAVGLNAVPVAEHAMALILAIAKNIAKHDRTLRSEGSVRLPSLLVSGKTLGIVGLGSIGVEVAKRAKAFDMRILAIKRRPSEELRLKLGLDFLGSQADLPHILKESDFVLLTVVLTPETMRMIGEKELRMMNPSAYLINVSRGEVTDEEALVNALKSGVIAGAALDVFQIEPVTRGSPFLKLENVILTPHVAGSVGEKEMVKRAGFISQNIEKMISGQKPERIVDPKLKYVIR